MFAAINVQRFSAAILAQLAGEATADLAVDDPSGEVFHTMYANPASGAETLLMLLNTDWTTPGNVKTVTVRHKEWLFDVDVPERHSRFVHFFGDRVVITDESLHLQRENGKLCAFGLGEAVCTILAADGAGERRIVSFGNGTRLELP